MTRIKKKLQAIQKHPAFYAVCFWFVAGFVFLVIADNIIMPVFAGHLSFTSVIPDVVGKPKKEAEAILAKENLRIEWDSVGRASTKIPSGSVLVQVPNSGRRVKEGRIVHLIASTGMREVVLPELRGKSQHQAEVTIDRLGLVLGRTIQGAHASIPRGVVIRTEPGAGKTVRMGTRVSIVISAGAVLGRQRLPDFSGLSLERASHQLDSLGFQIGSVERKDAKGKAGNTILQQHPSSGEYLDPGTKVDFVIVD